MATVSPGGLFAWIESESDIARVCVASQRKIHLNRLLGGMHSLDFGYEGCHALRLRWYGKRLIVVSWERVVYIKIDWSDDGAGFRFLNQPELPHR